jgi:hypothetical protein
VPSSSTPISRLYPATSAASMAESFRSTRSASIPAPPRREYQIRQTSSDQKDHRNLGEWWRDPKATLAVPFDSAGPGTRSLCVQSYPKIIPGSICRRSHKAGIGATRQAGGPVLSRIEEEIYVIVQNSHTLCRSFRSSATIECRRPAYHGAVNECLPPLIRKMSISRNANTSDLSTGMAKSIGIV